MLWSRHFLLNTRSCYKLLRYNRKMQRPRGERGSTLLDAVVGTALMLVVFIGIVGAFRLTVMAVSNNKARAGAIALANERLEFVRSLPYASVGTSGGIPAGNIAQTETVNVNDVAYTRRTFISYEDDPADGSGGADTNGVRTDYKAVKVTVSWVVRDGTHTITLISRISPPGIETSVPGGTLSFNVVDSTLAPVSNAQIRIVNPGVSPAIDTTTYTDAAGTAVILGVPAGSGYRITTTKSGYSTAQTYASSATNTNPIPAHLGVALNQTTAATFAIDVLSRKTIETYSPVSTGTTTESFNDSSGIGSSSGVMVSSGAVRLEAGEDGYASSGTFLTTAISTSTLATWKRLAWSVSTTTGTSVTFRVYDSSGTNLIPDSQLPGNSGGFTVSPLNLASISTSTYPSIVIGATLATSNASNTPSIDSYSIAVDTGPRPLPDIGLTMTGAKTIGTTVGGAQVYKYQNSSITSGPSGSVTLSDIEWDSYTIRLAASTTYAMQSVCNPQPETLAPNSTQTTRVFVAPFTTNSLLVDVKNASGTPIANANVRLYRTSPAYNTTIASDGCGNAFFSGIAAGTGSNRYSLQVSASGYQTFNATSTINVSGTSRTSVILNN
jgi:hypothetical protein